MVRRNSQTVCFTLHFSINFFAHLLFREPPATPTPAEDSFSSSTEKQNEDSNDSLMLFVVIGVFFLAMMYIMFRVMFGCTKDPRQHKREMKYQKMLNA